MNTSTHQAKLNHCVPAVNLGMFAVSVLGPDGIANQAPDPTGPMPWFEHVINHGEPLHRDPQGELDRYHGELLAKGFDRFPVPIGLKFWKHYRFHGALYVMWFPELIIISKCGKAVYLQLA